MTGIVRITLFATAMTLTSISAQTANADRPLSITLASARDNYRPLLIFAPTDNADFIRQIQYLPSFMRDLHERDVLLVPVLAHDSGRSWGVTLPYADVGTLSQVEQDAARARFHIAPNAFTVLLIGKDGGEKLRSTTPLWPQQLIQTIDAMPMRQEEMRSRPSPD